jgi:hypothetical protein
VSIRDVIFWREVIRKDCAAWAGVCERGAEVVQASDRFEGVSGEVVGVR